MKVRVKAKTGARVNSILFDEPAGIYLVAVKARPIEGEANKAIIGLLSTELNIPKSQFRQIAGLKSKIKTFEF